MVFNWPMEVRLEAGAPVPLDGTLWMPESSRSVVVVAHGSRHGIRRITRFADALSARGIGALLINLLTPGEQAIDPMIADLGLDVALLANRLTASLDAVAVELPMADIHIGLLGANEGAAPALIAAARRRHEVRAVVSTGGRPEQALQFLPCVVAPTRLIVGADDEALLRRIQDAAARSEVVHDLKIIGRETHSFDEPATMERVAELAAEWFALHLASEGRKTAVQRSPASQRTASHKQTAE